jgi:hypothetical protein
MSSLCAKDKLVEHGDLLSELKRVQEGLVGGFERELTTPNTLLRSRFLMDRAVTYITENFSRTIYIYIKHRFNNLGSKPWSYDASNRQENLGVGSSSSLPGHNVWVAGSYGCNSKLTRNLQGALIPTSQETTSITVN